MHVQLYMVYNLCTIVHGQAHFGNFFVSHEKFCHIFWFSRFFSPIIEFLSRGQKFISTLLSDILTILGIIWACKVFLDFCYIVAVSFIGGGNWSTRIFH
jgi:hypothetical protein